MGQHTLIFAAMFLGLGLGLLLTGQEGAFPMAIVAICDFFGITVFIGALKMIVAPLILFSILAGITSLAEKMELWAIGWRTLAFYFGTTTIAVLIGLMLVLSIQPGYRGKRAEIRAKSTQTLQEIEHEYGAKEQRIRRAKNKSATDTIRDNVKQVIMNPFASLATANSLGIIFFAILMGVALILIGEKGRPVMPIIEGINAAILKITGWIMWGAPVFIFCLVASLIAKHGTTVFGTLFWYVIAVLIGIACHVVFLLGVVKFVGKMSPLTFLRGIRKAWAVAFATRSSAATLPVTMGCVRDELNVPSKVSDFVLPIGATVNMDGTALYEGVAIIFLIQLFGGLDGAMIELTAVTTVVIFITAVLASIGAAAVPDAGLVTMVLVANAVGLDPRFIVLIFPVDAFLDMFRTSTNVIGDSVGAVVVNRLTGGTLKDQ